MNQYSVWKYLLIIFVIVVGIVYALPNMYGKDPALQITTSRGFALPADLTANIDDALLVEQISFKSREQQGNRMLYRFNNAEDQIKAADVVRSALGDQYVVALNLAHATPDGLRSIGGKPMTLGLDLQGGVHFLMQVDMDTARDNNWIGSWTTSVRHCVMKAYVMYRSGMKVTDCWRYFALLKTGTGP